MFVRSIVWCIFPTLILLVAVLFYLCLQLFSFLLITQKPSSLNELTSYALQESTPSQSLVIDIASYTLLDRTNWLNPHFLGLRSIQRNPDLFTSFVPERWSNDFFKPKPFNRSPKRAFPTHQWWLPWVTSTSPGQVSYINQVPYILGVVNEVSSSGFSNSRAGLEILYPFCSFIQQSHNKDKSSEQGTAFVQGLKQLTDGERSGLFVGMVSQSSEDAVLSHVVEDYNSMSVTKRWDFSLFQRGDRGVPLVNQEKRFVSMYARAIRGSAFIAIELPPHATFRLSTLISLTQKHYKFTISKIQSFTNSFREPSFTCRTLQGNSIRTDAFEIELEEDKTRWVVIFDTPVDIKCVPGEKQDFIESIAPLKSRLNVRIALTDMSKHPGIKSKELVGFENLKPVTNESMSRSKLRWQILTHLKKTNQSIAQFVASINKQHNKLEYLENYIRYFPLLDKLKELNSTVTTPFTVRLVEWGSLEFFEQLKTSSLMIIPGTLEHHPNNIWFTSEIIQQMSKAVFDGSLSVLGLGGTMSGTMIAIFGAIFDIDLKPVGTLSYEDPVPVRMEEQIWKTLPPETHDIFSRVSPASVPKSLPFQKSIELVDSGFDEYPLNMYCRPLQMSGSLVSCDASVANFYYQGKNSIQWLGMDFHHSGPAIQQEWTRVLLRAISAAGCTLSHTDGKNPCASVKNITVIWDKDALEQSKFIKDFLSLTADLSQNKVVPFAEISLEKTLGFLQGLQKRRLGNVNEKDKVVSVPDTQLHTLRDSILKHALTHVEEAYVNVSIGSFYGSLNYKLKGRLMHGYESHSLYPPVGLNPLNPVWDIYRSLMYMSLLHRNLEYTESIASVFEMPSEYTVGLEDDESTCLPTIFGPVCTRSFGISPPCRYSPVFSLNKTNLSEGTDKTKIFDDGDFRPICVVNTVTRTIMNWSLSDEIKKANKREAFLLSHQKGGKPAAYTVNMPLTSWDISIRDSAGVYHNPFDYLGDHWKEAMRWAVTQDLVGALKLDAKIWMKKNSADDLALWVRMIHRYAQIVLIADGIGMNREKETGLQWLKNSLLMFFNNKFDNIGLLYDASLGGILSCGCDRVTGSGFCVPALRPGYLQQKSLYKTSSELPYVNTHAWLSAACSGLTNLGSDAGSGLFQNHHALWGYIVFSAAVAVKMDPSFAHKRVRLQTSKKVHRPKIHHLVMALIQDYSSPFNGVNDLYSDEEIKLLQTYFPPARHKDWYKLHSYGTNVGYSEGVFLTQNSLTEATFGYWAAALYASAIKDENLARWERFLAGLEIHSGTVFWQSSPSVSWLPSQLQYFGIFGTVGEFEFFASTQSSSDSFSVYHEQLVPLTFLSFEALRPDWYMFIANLWLQPCLSNIKKCKASGADLGLLLINLFTKDWKNEMGTDLFSHNVNETRASAAIDAALAQITNSPCFKVGSFECGFHTITNSVFWAAIASVIGGAPAIIKRWRTFMMQQGELNEFACTSQKCDFLQIHESVLKQLVGASKILNIGGENDTEHPYCSYDVIPQTTYCPTLLTSSRNHVSRITAGAGATDGGAAGAGTATPVAAALESPEYLAHRLLVEFGKTRTNYNSLVPRIVEVMRLYRDYGPTRCPVPVVANLEELLNDEALIRIEHRYPNSLDAGFLVLCTERRALRSGGGGKYYFIDSSNRLVGCHKSDLPNYVDKKVLRGPVLLKNLIFVFIMRGAFGLDPRCKSSNPQRLLEFYENLAKEGKSMDIQRLVRVWSMEIFPEAPYDAGFPHCSLLWVKNMHVGAHITKWRRSHWHTNQLRVQDLYSTASAQLLSSTLMRGGPSQQLVLNHDNAPSYNNYLNTETITTPSQHHIPPPLVPQSLDLSTLQQNTDQMKRRRLSDGYWPPETHLQDQHQHYCSVAAPQPPSSSYERPGTAESPIALLSERSAAAGATLKNPQTLLTPMSRFPSVAMDEYSVDSSEALCKPVTSNVYENNLTEDIDSIQMRKQSDAFSVSSKVPVCSSLHHPPPASMTVASDPSSFLYCPASQVTQNRSTPDTNAQPCSLYQVKQDQQNLAKAPIAAYTNTSYDVLSDAAQARRLYLTFDQFVSSLDKNDVMSWITRTLDNLTSPIVSAAVQLMVTHMQIEASPSRDFNEGGARSELLSVLYQIKSEKDLKECLRILLACLVQQQRLEELAQQQQQLTSYFVPNETSVCGQNYMDQLSSGNVVRNENILLSSPGQVKMEKIRESNTLLQNPVTLVSNNSHRLIPDSREKRYSSSSSDQHTSEGGTISSTPSSPYYTPQHVKRQKCNKKELCSLLGRQSLASEMYSDAPPPYEEEIQTQYEDKQYSEPEWKYVSLYLDKKPLKDMSKHFCDYMLYKQRQRSFDETTSSTHINRNSECLTSDISYDDHHYQRDVGTTLLETASSLSPSTCYGRDKSKEYLLDSSGSTAYFENKMGNPCFNFEDEICHDVDVGQQLNTMKTPFVKKNKSTFQSNKD